MALINRKETAAPEVTESEAAPVAAESTTQEQTPTQESTKSTAVAVKAAPTVPVGSKGSFYMNTPEMLQVVQEAQYGTFASLIASNGTILIADDKTDIGKTVDFVVIAEKQKEVCSPGSNEPEAKEFFAAAYMGELTMDGRSIDECVQDAKDAGYTKADKKIYTDVFIMVQSEGVLEGEVVMLQCAPMSLRTWNSFKAQLMMKAALGSAATDGPPVIRATAVGATNANKQSYTTYRFSLV
jgi:hypothetical protein